MGGKLINLGGVIQPWAHQEPFGGSNSSPGRACCFWLKLPARLSELGVNLLPCFGYKKAWEAEGKGSAPWANIFHLKLVKRRIKKKKIQAKMLL